MKLRKAVLVVKALILSAAAAATERDYLAGVTWMPAATRLKLQLVGVRKTYTRNIVPAATQAIITMQASW